MTLCLSKTFSAWKAHINARRLSPKCGQRTEEVVCSYHFQRTLNQHHVGILFEIQHYHLNPLVALLIIQRRHLAFTETLGSVMNIGEAAPSPSTYSDGKPESVSDGLPESCLIFVTNL